MGGIDTFTAAGATPALEIWMNQDVDPATTIFCTSKNYVYNTALNSTDSPYGSRGFIPIKKGGDAAIYRVGQAVDTGWTNGTLFQNSVGFKRGTGGDAVGTVTPNDPAVTYKFP